jgi:WD40-like Beta Propeller Repeat/IPT/TIG domain
MRVVGRLVFILAFALSAMGADRVSADSVVEYAQHVYASRLARVLNPTAADKRLPVSVAQTFGTSDQRMVFQSFRDGNWEIYASDITGASLRRLTSDGASDIQPRLSFNGQQIVFSSNRSGRFHIYSMSWNGSDLRQLTDGEHDNSEPTWSPDGQQIAFISDRPSNGLRIPTLHVMSANGLNLVPRDAFAVAPEWHPIEPGRIVFVKIGSFSGETSSRLVTTDGLGITSDCPLTDLPRYSIDGQNLVYMCDSDQNGFTALWRWQNFGSATQLVAPASNADLILGGWTPDGGGVLYTTTTYASPNKSSIASSAAQIYSIPAAVVTPINTGGSILVPDVRWNDTQAPVISSFVVPAVSSARQAQASWEAFDAGPAGVLAFDWQYRIGAAGSWVDARTASPLTTANPAAPPSSPSDPVIIGYNGAQAGNRVWLRVRARDRAGNVLPWPVGDRGARFTTVVGFAAAGSLIDNRGAPVADQRITVSPSSSALPVFNTDATGGFLVASGTDDFTMSVTRQGYASPPSTQFRDPSNNGTVQFVYPYLFGPDNVIANSSFEDGANPNQPSGWTMTTQGDTQMLLDRGRATGARGLLLWSNFSSSVSGARQSVTIPASMENPTLALMYMAKLRNASFGCDPSAANEITVNVISGSMTNTVLSLRNVTGAAANTWRFFSTDLSAYKGQTVSILLSRGTGTCNDVDFDDVTLSSWRTPAVQSITPDKAKPGEPLTLTISGVNFAANTQVSVGGIALATTVVNSVTMQVSAQAGLPFGIHPVTVTVPGLAPITAGQRVRIVGSLVHLPTVQYLP